MQLDRPQLSLVVPFRNVEPYIEACLNSILTQRFHDFEVILIDDDSSDGSRRIAESFQARDKRFRIVTAPNNVGLGPARDLGVDAAIGDGIVFLDSDDLLAGPDALGCLVDAAERSDCNVVIGSCERLEPDGSRMEEDRHQDRAAGGRPGTVLRGIDALLASMKIGRAHV